MNTSQIRPGIRYKRPGVPSNRVGGHAIRPVPPNIGLLIQVQIEYQHLVYKYRAVNSHLFNSLQLYTPVCMNCISARYICESANVLF